MPEAAQAGSSRYMDPSSRRSLSVFTRPTTWSMFFIGQHRRQVIKQAPFHVVLNGRPLRLTPCVAPFTSQSPPRDSPSVTSGFPEGRRSSPLLRNSGLDKKVSRAKKSGTTRLTSYQNAVYCNCHDNGIAQSVFSSRLWIDRPSEPRRTNDLRPAPGLRPCGSKRTAL